MSLLSGYRVLVVEDEVIVANRLKNIICNLKGVCIGAVATEEKAVQEKPDVIFMDIALKKNGSGVQAAKKIANEITTIIIFTTAYGESDIVASAMEAFPYGYVTKPYSEVQIETAAATAIARFTLEQQLYQSELRYKMAAEIVQLAALTYQPETETLHITAPQSLLNRAGLSQIMTVEEFAQNIVKDQQTSFMMKLKGGYNVKTSVKFINPSTQEVVWLEIHLSKQKDKITHSMIGAAVDQTITVKREERLQISNLVIEQLKAGVLLLNEQGEIINSNPEAERIIGKQKSELINTIFSSYLHNNRISDEKSNEYDEEYMICKNQQESAYYSISVRNFSHPHSDVKSIALMTNIDHIKRRDEQIINLAYADQLTGCRNRNCFQKTIEEYKETTKTCSLIFIDLTKFKSINDNYGHEFGDKVLEAVGSRLLQNTRKKDMVFRVGGDEFVVLTESLLIGTEALAKNLYNTFREPITICDRSLKVNMAIGIASGETSHIDQMLRHADIAMYTAKNPSRPHIVTFTQAIYTQVSHRLNVEQALEKAIAEREIRAHFQPIMDEKGNVVACESLCRWRCGNAGYVSPIHFIALAEESHQIHSLGLLMFYESCIALSIFDNLGLDSLSIHINISNSQLQPTEFVANITKLITEFDIDCSRLILEVTESCMRSSQSLETLTKLQALGFHIAIDDFGTGYSSITELFKFNYDHIKIDKSLLPTSLPNHEKNDTDVFSTVVSLCRKLCSSVIIEGVETPTQVSIANESGCNFYQGFYFSKPLTLNKFIEFVKSSKTDELSVETA